MTDLDRLALEYGLLRRQDEDEAWTEPDTDLRARIVERHDEVTDGDGPHLADALRTFSGARLERLARTFNVRGESEEHLRGRIFEVISGRHFELTERTAIALEMLGVTWRSFGPSMPPPLALPERGASRWAQLG